MKISKPELDKITKFMLEADKLKAVDEAFSVEKAERLKNWITSLK